MTAELALVTEWLDENASLVEELQVEVAEKEATLREKHRAFEMAESEYEIMRVTSAQSSAEFLVVIQQAEESTREQLLVAREDLNERELGSVDLEVEHQLAQRLYGELIELHERARINAETATTQLQLVDPAFASGQPIDSGRRAQVLFALAAGLILSTVAAFLVNAVRT